VASKEGERVRYLTKGKDARRSRPPLWVHQKKKKKERREHSGRNFPRPQRKEEGFKKRKGKPDGQGHPYLLRSRGRKQGREQLLRSETGKGRGGKEPICVIVLGETRKKKRGGSLTRGRRKTRGVLGIEGQ